MPLDRLLYRDVAVHSQERQQAIFTSSGTIIVRPFDDLSIGQKWLPTVTSIDPHDFANACIIHRVASNMGILPGLFAEGDEALIEECIALMDDHIDDKQALVNQWIASWNRIAEDRQVLEDYQGMFQPLESSKIKAGGRKFTFFGSFSTFAEDHFYHILHYAFYRKDQHWLIGIFRKSKPITPLWFFVQWAELYLSNIDNRGFHPGYFQRFIQLYTQLDQCKNKYPEKSEEIEAAKQHLNYLIGGWYHHLIGDIEATLNTVYDDGELDAKFLQRIREQNDALRPVEDGIGASHAEVYQGEDWGEEITEESLMDPTPPNTPTPEAVEEDEGTEPRPLSLESELLAPEEQEKRIKEEKAKKAKAAREKAMRDMQLQMERVAEKLNALTISEEKPFLKSFVLQAVSNILNGTRPVSTNQTLKEALEEIVQLYDYLNNPTRHECPQRLTSILSRNISGYQYPSEKIMLRAVCDCLKTFLLTHHEHKTRSRKLPLYRTAGTADETELTHALLERHSQFHPFELLSIYARTQSPVIKETIYRISQHASYARFIQVFRLSHLMHAQPRGAILGLLAAASTLTNSRNNELCLAFRAMQGKSTSELAHPGSNNSPVIRPNTFPS